MTIAEGSGYALISAIAYQVVRAKCINFVKDAGAVEVAELGSI